MSKYICDGHEYSIRNASHENFNVYEILNNYGSHVATYWRSVEMDTWRLSVVDGEDFTRIGHMHEDDLPDNLLDQWAIHEYVRWAMDRDTVESHYA